MECPKCQSSKLQKKGIRAGKQRYRCTECGANFTKGVEYHPLKHYPPLTEIVCPQCGDSHIIRDGKLLNGTPRYQCQSCGSNFSAKTLYSHKKAIQWKCPYCNGKLIHAGNSKKGNNSYLCKNCGKSCTADQSGKPIKRDLPFSLVNDSVHCPYCQTLKVKKAGYTKYGNQKYECKVCGHVFNKDSKVKGDIQEVIISILNGKSIKQRAQDSGYSGEYLRKIMAPYYKTEKITAEQKKNIIRYGYFLNVPVDYMAEYIKCSEHKCKEVLQKFKKSLMSTNHDAIE